MQVCLRIYYYAGPCLNFKRSVLSNTVFSDSRAGLICCHCDELKILILEYESTAADADSIEDPRDSLPPSTSELIIAWLSKQRTVRSKPFVNCWDRFERLYVHRSGTHS